MAETRALARREGLARLPVLGTLRSMVRYVGDRSAPLAGKLVLAGAVLYAVLPVDLVPDVVPFVGWLDDAGVLGVAWAIFARYLRRWEAGEGP